MVYICVVSLFGFFGFFPSSLDLSVTLYGRGKKPRKGGNRRRRVPASKEGAAATDGHHAGRREGIPMCKVPAWGRKTGAANFGIAEASKFRPAKLHP
jgi:hypothetical protein